MWAPTMWAALATMAATGFAQGDAAFGGAALHDSSFAAIAANMGLYDLLGVDVTADEAQIRTAFKKGALVSHPDKGGSSKDFVSLTTAFQVLSCPNRRACYDRECKERKTQNDNDCQNLASSRAVVRANSVEAAGARVTCSLEKLRSLLQLLDRSTRQALMMTIPAPVQLALIDFIKSYPDENKADNSHHVVTDKCGQRCLRATGGSVRVIQSGGKCHAQLDIQYLRFYSRWSSSDDADQHRVVFVQIRDRLVSAADANSRFWEDSNCVSKIFAEELALAKTSRSEMGLSVYVEMRAPQWVSNSYHVTSRVVPLAEAISLRAHLLKARLTSWESFRAEWVALLQGGQRGKSAEDAEAYVDAARKSSLQQRLFSVVVSADRALSVKAKIEAKATIASDRHKVTKKGKKRKQDFDLAHRSWPYLSEARLRAHDERCRHATAKSRKARIC